MTILPQDFVSKWLAPHSLPGTAFFLVHEGTLQNKVSVSVVLSVTKCSKGWVAPSLVVLISLSEKWEICPWISQEIYEILRPYEPAELFCRIDPAVLQGIEVKSIDQTVQETEELRRKTEDAVALKTKLDDLEHKNSDG